MKRNALATTLVVLLFITGAIAARYAVRYGFRTRDLRALQPKVLNINSRMAIAQSLLNDTLEYSKRNPAIDPVLQSLNMKTNAASGAGDSRAPAK